MRALRVGSDHYLPVHGKLRKYSPSSHLPVTSALLVSVHVQAIESRPYSDQSVRIWTAQHRVLCGIRSKSIADFGASDPPVPIGVDH